MEDDQVLIYRSIADFLYAYALILVYKNIPKFGIRGLLGMVHSFIRGFGTKKG